MRESNCTHSIPEPMRLTHMQMLLTLRHSLFVRCLLPTSPKSDMGTCWSSFCGARRDPMPPSYESVMRAVTEARVVGPRGSTYPRFMTQVMVRERTPGGPSSVDRPGTLYFFDSDWLCQLEGRRPVTFSYLEIMLVRSVDGWVELHRGYGRWIETILSFQAPLPRTLIVE